MVGGQQTPGNIQGATGPFAPLVECGPFRLELGILCSAGGAMIRTLLNLGTRLFPAGFFERFVIFCLICRHIWAKWLGLPLRLLDCIAVHIRLEFT